MLFFKKKKTQNNQQKDGKFAPPVKRMINILHLVWKYLKLEGKGTFYLENDSEKRVLKCVLLVILYFCLKCRTQRSRIRSLPTASTTLQCWMCLAFGLWKVWNGEVGLSSMGLQRELMNLPCRVHPAWLCITWVIFRSSFAMAQLVFLPSGCGNIFRRES